MKSQQSSPKLIWVLWLPPLVLLANLAVLGLTIAYSSLNLRPYTPPHDPYQLYAARLAGLYLVVLLPVAASVVYLWPVFIWARRAAKQSVGVEVTRPETPETVLIRAGNSPVSLAVFSLLSWVLLNVPLLFRLPQVFEVITVGMWAHFIVRPFLAGLIAAAAVFFIADFVCRTRVWPTLFQNFQIQGNRRLWKIRVFHRLFLLWLAISFLPLCAVAMTAFLRMDLLPPEAGVPAPRVMWVIILIGATAALGGAVLAWLLSRSISQPLRRLEALMARLRERDFSVREQVGSTDEIATLAEGFNLMTERISESYAALETRNRELTEALKRVAFLESVKRGLDRFVPEAVRKAIEENPEEPALRKIQKDVTVLFLDIEGYTKLSEELAGEELSSLIERYFSLFLPDIQAEGGDINETTGDGLMMIFQRMSGEGHAVSAVRTALAIHEKTTIANQEDQGLHPPIFVNIGISSGHCDVGSIRLHSIAGERWTFTATGPVTNLASRLGDYADHGQILLSSETARRAHGHFNLQSLGVVTLKNVSRPLEVWEVPVDNPPAGNTEPT